MWGGKKRCPKSDVFGKRNFPSEARRQFVFGLVSIVNFVYSLFSQPIPWGLPRGVGSLRNFRDNSRYWTGNQISRLSLPANTTTSGLRANELKDGWRRRGRNLWSNQASKFVLRCLILSKNNIFSWKPLLQYKGGGYYLIGSFIHVFSVI